MNVEKKPKIMIIPMIDIIFFLLVFFMMSMLTMVVQKSINLNLPQTASAQIDLQKTLPIRRYHLCRAGEDPEGLLQETHGDRKEQKSRYLYRPACG